MNLLKGLALLLSLVAVAMPARSDQPILLFAAASLKEAVETAVTAFAVHAGIETTIVLAASSTLARQIAAGAPADIFLSANRDWMAYLDKNGLIDGETVRSIASNTMVVVAPERANFDESNWQVDKLRSQTIAIADPDHVPAGIYAKQALMALNLWTSVEKQAVRAANVRDALAFAARGEVPFAVIYASDAQAQPKVMTIAKLPSDLHDPIDYQAAVILHGRASKRALEFLDFLTGSEGQQIFAEYGFAPRLAEP